MDPQPKRRLSRSKVLAAALLVLIVAYSTCDDQHQEKPANENLSVVKPSWQLLEKDYEEMLSPIAHLSETHPDTYWFIVSWLGTAYSTPSWQGYDSEKWQDKTKRKGIDCSGFARVMQDIIYCKSIRGSSQQIYTRYCTPIKRKHIQMGDLVFFKAPHAKSERIVHVGVYLQDDVFVHATSARSAESGFGLSINTLLEPHWKEDLIAIGRVKP